MYDAAMYGGWKECGKQRMDNKVRTMKRKDGTLWSFSLAGTPYLCWLSENVGNVPDCKISNLHTIMTERTSFLLNGCSRQCSCCWSLPLTIGLTACVAERRHGIGYGFNLTKGVSPQGLRCPILKKEVPYSLCGCLDGE